MPPPPLRNILSTNGIFLAGINSIMYYTPSIILLAGINDSRTALLISMGPAAVNAAGTVMGMFCIDFVGRRSPPPPPPPPQPSVSPQSGA